jgi:hypothetical protein
LLDKFCIASSAWAFYGDVFFFLDDFLLVEGASFFPDFFLP